MESTRQAKIARLLQKELSELFRRQTAAMGGVLVSVSAVRVSPDLSVARGYLSIFPSEKAKDIIESINHNAKTIRYDLAKTLRYQLRKMPALTMVVIGASPYSQLRSPKIRISGSAVRLPTALTRLFALV